MESEVKEYAPAFPTGDNPESRLYANPGMSLRDYFAAKAMQALLTGVETYSGEHMAKLAYKMSDAMMKVRDV